MKRRLLPLFLMHVPKSAGTSVFALLSSAFKSNEICPSPPHGGWTWRASDVRGYSLYWGHFTSDFLDEMGNGTRLIMLRHPLNRVVSLYDYWRSYRWDYIRTSLPAFNGPAIAKSSDLSAFLETNTKLTLDLYNTTARQLLGSRFDALASDEQAAIDEAIRVLDGFAWVGITELFVPSIARLSTLLGLRLPKSLPKERSTYDVPPDDPQCEPVSPTRPDESQRRRILEGNAMDLAIYTHARETLERRSADASRRGFLDRFVRTSSS